MQSKQVSALIFSAAAVLAGASACSSSDTTIAADASSPDSPSGSLPFDAGPDGASPATDSPSAAAEASPSPAQDVTSPGDSGGDGPGDEAQVEGASDAGVGTDASAQADVFSAQPDATVDVAAAVPPDATADVAAALTPDATPDAAVVDAARDASSGPAVSEGGLDACGIDANVPDVPIGDAGATTVGCVTCVNTNCAALAAACTTSCACPTELGALLACVATGQALFTCIQVTPGSATVTALATCGALACSRACGL